MPTQLHNTGEEVILRDFFEESVSKPSSISIGLFLDSEDDLDDGSDIENVNTEPQGSEYSRETLSFGESDFTAESNSVDNWQVVFADLTYDTSDSTQDVDAYMVVISYESQETEDSDSQEHLLFTGDLDQTYDLESIDSFTLSGAGLEID